MIKDAPERFDWDEFRLAIHAMQVGDPELPWDVPNMFYARNIVYQIGQINRREYVTRSIKSGNGGRIFVARHQ